MRGLGIHKNIPVSVTKLKLGLRVCFISSHLTADKPFPVNPRAIAGPPKMSLLLEPKNMPALNIEPNISTCCAHGWPWLVHQFKKQGQMFVQNLNRIVRNPNVTPGLILYCTTDCIIIHLLFLENFPTNTEVLNRLGNRNACGQKGLIWVTYGCYNSNPY